MNNTEQSKRMKKFWDLVRAGKRPPPGPKGPRVVRYRTKAEYNHAAGGCPRKLIVTLDKDMIHIRESKRRKATKTYSMELWRVYQWLVSTTALRELEKQNGT